MNELLEAAKKIKKVERNQHMNPTRDMVEVAVEFQKGNLTDKQVGVVLGIPYFNSRCATHTIIKQGIRFGWIEINFKK